MVNKDLLDELTKMISKIDMACYTFRRSAILAKKLNVELPLVLKNKIAGLAAMLNICEKVEYYYRSIDDVLFGDWVKANDQPTKDEIKLVIDLLNQYRELKHEVGDVEYFIPHQLKGDKYD